MKQKQGYESVAIISRQDLMNDLEAYHLYLIYFSGMPVLLHLSQ